MAVRRVLGSLGSAPRIRSPALTPSLPGVRQELGEGPFNNGSPFFQKDGETCPAFPPACTCSSQTPGPPGPQGPPVSPAAPPWQPLLPLADGWLLPCPSAGSWTEQPSPGLPHPGVHCTRLPAACHPQPMGPLLASPFLPLAPLPSQPPLLWCGTQHVPSSLIGVESQDLTPTWGRSSPSGP